MTMKNIYTKFLIASALLSSPLLASAQGCLTATNISTSAGSHVDGYTGDRGMANAATMGSPYGVAADAAGNVYIVDYFNNVIRKVDPSGIITTVAGTGTAGFSGDGGPATEAQLNGPRGVTLDGAGNIYIADKFNERIRKIDPTGTITTIAGNGLHGGLNNQPYGDDGPATAASLTYPASVALDCSGNMYIADLGSETVRKIDAGGTITLFAGTHAGGYNGDNIQATAAQLNEPSCVLADCAGNVYIADSWNNRIRMVNGGVITTIAGNGAATFGGDGGPATAASLWIPMGITLDACGNLYICDWQNNVVRKVTGTTIATFAGINYSNWHGYSGDDHAADSAELYLPAGLAIDGTGNVYIADYGNFVIREIGAAAPSPHRFANGTTQDITICVNETVNINTHLTVPNTINGKTQTWTVSRAPENGSLLGFNTTATANGATVNPTGVTYTPIPGFTGRDEFTVVTSDGVNTSSTTVNVFIVPAPNAGTITIGNEIAGNKINLVNASGDLNGVWSSDNASIANVDNSGTVTAISNGVVTISYTVTNKCGSRSTAAKVSSILNAPSGATWFPNPNNGTFQCAFNSTKNEQLELVATDVTGRVVYKQNIQATAGANVVNVKLPNTITKSSVIMVSLGNAQTKYPTAKVMVTE